MPLKPSQRNLLYLGLVLALALLPLVGGFHHHHDGEARSACWFCATASSAVEALAVQWGMVALAVVLFATPQITAPYWSDWRTPQRRGPPILSLA